MCTSVLRLVDMDLMLKKTKQYKTKNKPLSMRVKKIYIYINHSCRVNIGHSVLKAVGQDHQWQQQWTERATYGW